jgi:hypothetical protein
MRHDPEQRHLELDQPSLRTVWLSDVCSLRDDGAECTVFIAGQPAFRFDGRLDADRKLAAVQIVEAGAARVGAVLATFKMDDATLWRARQKLAKYGVCGLARGKTGPKGPRKLLPAVVRAAARLLAKGKTAAAIARELGISKPSARRALEAAGALPGTEEPEGTQQRLVDAAPIEASDVEQPETAPRGAGHEVAPGAVPGVPMEVAPAQAVDVRQPEIPSASEAQEPRPTAEAPRQVARASTPELAVLYARLGFAPDGEEEVVLESAPAVPFAGLLLAIPALLSTGLLGAARAAYGRLRKGIYVPSSHICHP